MAGLKKICLVKHIGVFNNIQHDLEIGVAGI